MRTESTCRTPGIFFSSAPIVSGNWKVRAVRLSEAVTKRSELTAKSTHFIIDVFMLALMEATLMTNERLNIRAATVALVRRGACTRLSLASLPSIPKIQPIGRRSNPAKK